MILSREYRNNLGYQIDIDRPHPLMAWEIERYNRNCYSYDGYNTKMDFNAGSQKGLQFGGGKETEVKYGKGLDPETVIKALQMIYSAGKAIDKAYTSETGTIIKNTYGKFMNKNPNWRPGFAGERHLMTSKGITYNFMGYLGPCLCSKA